MTPGEAWPAQWMTPTTGGAVVRPRRVSRAAALMGIIAPAKLNLGLAVMGRRTDGYHKLLTLMVALALADTVRVEPSSTLSLICDDPSLPVDDNLVLQAACALQSATGVRDGARITLTKRIPVAAGLGGGSSDAAATLLALDALWGTQVDDTTLLRLARNLGADVPFALYGGAMTARGIGDVLMPAPVPKSWLLLVVPRVEIPHKTAVLYGALTASEYGDGRAIVQQVAGLRQGEPLDSALLGNAFLAPLERIAPVVAATRAAIGDPVALSGSGPTLYMLHHREAEARQHATRLGQTLDATLIVTRTV